MTGMQLGRPSRRATSALATTAAVAALLGACDRKSEFSDPLQPSLDAQVRSAVSGWGVVPIGETAPQKPALVELGRALMFDRVLSGNRDVSCATCHRASAQGAGDGLSLAIGTGATGTGAARAPGAGRHFLPRNSPSLIDKGLGAPYLFWDGSVAEVGFGPVGAQGNNGRFATPAGPALPSGLDNLLAAQAMFPVVNRGEMRGLPGDRDALGQPNELAQYDDADYGGVWRAVMRRLVAIPGYVQLFRAAYPNTPVDGLEFRHAANAIAAFEVAAFTHTRSPFDRFLAREDGAMSTDAKRGALLFFGEARCSSCHAGPLLGGNSFANVGVPQIGPGTGTGAPLDYGRGDVDRISELRFFFRVPPLRNVELTGPYMHNGAFPTLEAVVKHYNDVPLSLHEYDLAQLDPSLRGSVHGDQTTIAAIERSIDPRIRTPLRLSDAELHDLVAFLKSLTDPAARDLTAIAPASVPSGLPVER